MKILQKIKWILLAFPFVLWAYGTEAPSVVAGGAPNNDGLVQKIYTFGDWDVECILQKVRDANNKDTDQVILASCSSRKIYKITDGEQAPSFAFAMTFERTNEGVTPYPSIYILSPLGVFLEPIYIRVDQQDPFAIPYRICERRGCTAIIRLDEKRTTQFRTGKSVDIRMFFDIRQQEPKAYNLSLKGSSAAFDFIIAAMEKQGQAVSIAELDALAKAKK